MKISKADLLILGASGIYMARPPVIRKTMLSVLRQAEKPLSFSEVKVHMCRALNRRHIDSKTIASNLTKLEKAQAVEKELLDGRIHYTLSGRLHTSTLMHTFRRLISDQPSPDIEKLLGNDRPMPHIVFLNPPGRDEGEVSAETGTAAVVSWQSPAEGIGSTLFNDYQTLDESTKRGICRLLLWAYWVGVRQDIEDTRAPYKSDITLHEKLEPLKAFIDEQVAKAEKSNDQRRLKGEKAIQKILEITQRLIEKDSLLDFLDFAVAQRGIIKDLQTAVILNLDGFTNSGERTFDRMTADLWDQASSGFAYINYTDKLAEFLPRHMLVASEVWDDFISSMFHSAKDFGLMTEIGGSLEESKQNLAKYLEYMPSLTKLMKNRKIIAMYVWGFRELDAAEEKEFRFSDFDKWLDAVKTGRCDHRVWLFEEKTLARVRKAYRLVRQGRPPPDLRIDKENWTLFDIYRYHPRGTDPSLWEEILEALKSRNAPENSQHRKDAVPEGVYSEFKKAESAYITKMLDDEEKQSSTS